MEFKLYAVRVFVENWDRALDFYTQTLEIPTTYRDDKMGWAQLATGEGHLALQRAVRGDDEHILVGRFVAVTLKVPDIEATYKTMKERDVEFLYPPKLQSWGGMLTHFCDPDGNTLTLIGSPK